MTTLRFDAKEFVPSTETRCCHSDASTIIPTTSSCTLLPPSRRSQRNDKKTNNSRHDRSFHSRLRKRDGLRSKPKQLNGRTNGIEVSDGDRSTLTNTKRGNNHCKNRDDFNSGKKKQIQSCELKKGAQKCSTVVVDATEFTPLYYPSKLAPDRMNCKFEFPELQSSTNVKQGKGEQATSSSCHSSSIWSSLNSKDLVRMKLNDEPSALSYGSKEIDNDNRCVTELFPLTQLVHTSRLKPTSEIDPPSATVLTGDVTERSESCPVINEIQCPPASIRKAAMPFEKLRDRWWTLLLLYEQEKQRLAESEATLDNRIHRTTAMSHDDKGDQTSSSKSGDNHSLCVGMISQTCCNLPQSSKISRCNDQYLPKLPLHEAIYRDDPQSLKQIISTVGFMLLNSQRDAEDLTPLELAVTLNRPHLVRMLCHAMDQKEGIAREGSTKIDPLLMATDLGHHECVHAILSVMGISSLLTTKDAQGNTAMHYSCWCDHGSETFQCLLNFITSSCSASLLFKVFSSRNNQEQTPLHVAAQSDRVDIIDIVLNHRSTSNVTFLSKILTIHDLEHQTPLLAAISSGSSDAVMSFLMWRGNNCSFKHSTPLKEKGGTSLGSLVAKSALCPLTWAVKCKNIDMVKLLLEFNDPSSESGYKLNDALYSSVDGCSIHDDQDIGCSMLEIIRVLVEAGANPCVLDVGTHGSSPSSAISLAASQLKLACLAQLLDSYDHYLMRVRHQRRHDPKLQSQPESFFVTMETAEDTERGAALREALVLSLSMACSSLSPEIYSSCIAHIQCCLLLYQRNAKLRSNEIQRLKESLLPHSFRGKLLINDSLSPQFAVNSSWKAKSEPNHCSSMMMDLPWFDVRSFTRCAMLSSSNILSSLPSEPELDLKADVRLVCNDGDLLLAHEMILEKSHKFAAAIRFARLTKEQKHDTDNRDLSTNQLLEVHVNLSSTLCRRLLEHIYHGSLATGFSKDRVEVCSELLEIMLVGDEYICTSLVYECLWRLLASSDNYDRCFCSFCRVDFPANCCSSSSADRSVGLSHLVSSETVLDVLSALQHNFCFFNDDCSLNFSAENLVSALREMALCIALCDFGSVIRGEAFEAQFNCSIDESVVQEAGSPQGMFLYMLLQDAVDLWQGVSLTL